MLVKVNRLNSDVIFVRRNSTMDDIRSLIQALMEVNRYSVEAAKRAYTPSPALSFMENEVERLEDLTVKLERLGVNTGSLMTDLDSLETALKENSVEASRIAFTNVHLDLAMAIDKIAHRLLDLIDQAQLCK